MTPEDWLEAFSHHPRIGERKEGSATASWEKQEQAGTRDARAEVLQSLARGNREYEKKFGYVYLVCATGKTAEQMLTMLLERLGNGPEAELRVAAGEQAKITRIRLEKWLQP